MNRRPCPVGEATQRMRAMVGLDIEYRLGTGNYHPDGVYGDAYDCAGAICEAYKLTRHRPGFARGPLPRGWERFADVVDDLNTNSMIADCVIKQDLFRFVNEHEPLLPGDLLAYPTIRIRAADMIVHEWIGHVVFIVAGIGRTGGGPYSGIPIWHCHGPNGRRPAVTPGTAGLIDIHNQSWKAPWSRAWPLRVVP